LYNSTEKKIEIKFPSTFDGKSAQIVRAFNFYELRESFFVGNQFDWIIGDCAVESFNQFNLQSTHPAFGNG
jgi:hypothetical protein